MKKTGLKKLPTINRTVLTTVASITLIFAVMIGVSLNLLYRGNIDRAKAVDAADAMNITTSLRENLDYMSRLLILAQDSVTAHDLQSETESLNESVDRILATMLDLDSSVHCVWCVINKGANNQDEPYISEFLKTDGKVFEASRVSPAVILSDPGNAPWYYLPMTTGEVYFSASTVCFHSIDNEHDYSMTISAPVYAGGEIIGVFGIDILYKEALSSIFNIHEWHDKVIMLLDQDLTVLYSNDRGLIKRTLADLGYSDVEKIRAAVSGSEIFSDEIVSPVIGERIFLHLMPITVGLGKVQDTLYLHIGTPLSVLNDATNKITYYLIITSLLCVLLVFYITSHNARKLVKPLSDLAGRARQVITGEYNANVFDVSGYDENSKSEFLALRRAFNEMLNTLQVNLRSVEKTVDERTAELNQLNIYIRMVVDHATNMFMLFDRDLKMIYCSSSLLDMLGVDDYSEVINKTLRDGVHAIHPDREYTARSAARFERIVAGEDYIVTDDNINWPGKGLRSFHITYRRILNREGAYDGVVLTLLDVTEVRLQEAERRVIDMLNSSQTACLVWDESGHIIAYNKESARIFGLQDDLTAEEFDEIFFAMEPVLQPGGKRTGVIRRELLLEALETGFAQIKGQLQRADGKPIHVSVTIARIEWIPGYRLIVYLNDITDLTMKEAEAREAEERIRLMLDATPLSCLFFDSNANLIDCNQEALNLFRVPDKRTYLEHFYEFMPERQPGGAPSVAEAKRYVQVAYEKGHIAFEWVHQASDGELIPAEITLERVKFGDDSILLGYVRDLRKFKRAMEEVTEAEAASEAKSIFLANMSHEIRTPMNAVLGMAELLLQEELSYRQQRYAGDIHLAATSLLGIIDDILDVSKIQAGKFSLVPVHYDFNALIENLSSMVQFMVKGKDVTFRLSMQEKIPALFGDNVRIRQVLLNLLGNAVKFTDKGSIQLIVSSSDKMINVTVSDTGIGIPAESLPTLFDAFEQADAEKNRDKSGTGLGLTISKSIIEMMGGSISVESVYGQGSSFRIEFPKVPGNEEMIYKDNAGIYSVYAPDARVLIVDDNTANLNVASGLLSLCGVTVETALSGREAIELVQRNQYDIVFMDQRMPEMSGIEATREIRKLGIHVTVVALTASAMDGDREHMLSAGMDDYLVKPIVKSELQRVLLRWIPREKLQKAPPAAELRRNIDDEAHTEFWSRIGQIEGIDLSVGLGRIDGQRGVYEKTLKLMVQEIEKSEKNLPAFLSAGNMGSFRIEVHGIKGALANIGAAELAEAAYALEQAADNGALTFCTLLLPDLLKGLGDLNRKLKDAFSTISHDEGPFMISSELRSVFSRMMDAINEGDLVQIDYDLESLDALCTGGTLTDELEQIKDLVMMMNYDGAAARITDLLSVKK